MEKMAGLKFLEQKYKGKKVLITGHTGFKGTWMLITLNLLGAEVYGIALKADEDSMFEKVNGNSLCKSFEIDIRNKDAVVEKINEIQPDFVFHLAAQSLVKKSYEDAHYTFETNVMGTVNVLEGIKKINGKCAVVLITTDKVYENKEWDYPYRETDQLGGYDPYSSSKACAEIAINSFRLSFFNIKNIDEHKKYISSVRAGNVIGGGDFSKDRIIPDLVKAISNNEVLTVRSPESVRPWQHVLEPIKGYLLLGTYLFDEKSELTKAFNFGPHINDNLTVRELIESSINVWGKGTFRIESSANQVHEAKLLKLDISHTCQMLQWKPKLRAAEAIKMTILWYKESSESGTLKYTENQILQFFEDGV
jgi:CDP-glucose 4,6-dehydratase